MTVATSAPTWGTSSTSGSRPTSLLISGLTSGCPVGNDSAPTTDRPAAGAAFDRNDVTRSNTGVWFERTAIRLNPFACQYLMKVGRPLEAKSGPTVKTHGSWSGATRPRNPADAETRGIPRWLASGTIGNVI